MQVSDTIAGIAIHISRAEAEDLIDDLGCITSPAGDELHYKLNEALGRTRPCADQADDCATALASRWTDVSATTWGMLQNQGGTMRNDREDDGN